MTENIRETSIYSDLSEDRITDLGFNILRESDLDLELPFRNIRKFIIQAISRKFGGKIVLLDEVDTTMNIAKDLALSKKLNSGDAVIAKRQKNGKGQNDRKWSSENGNLHMNLLLDTTDPEIRKTASLFTGLSVSEAIDGFGLISQIKWPNDIVIESTKGIREKISGILVEINENIKIANIGIGVNLNTTPTDVKIDEFVEGATSLREQIGTQINFVFFLLKLFERMEENFLDIKFGRKAEIFQKINDRLVGRLKKVRLHNGIKGVIQGEGILFGIDEDGSIRIDDKSFPAGRLEIMK